MYMLLCGSVHVWRRCVIFYVHETNLEMCAHVSVCLVVILLMYMCMHEVNLGR